MVTNLVEKASGFLEGRFVQGYWFPSFLSVSLVLITRILVIGPKDVWNWWQSLGTISISSNGTQNSDNFAQVWIIAGILLIITLVAFLLQVFSFSIIQLFEGYWPLPIRRYWSKKVVERWKQIREQRGDADAKGDLVRYSHYQDILYHLYPSEENLILPTRLGNVLQSAEAYPSTSYGLNTVFWWPRIVSMIPKEEQDAIEDAVVPMIMMINVSGLLTALTFIGPIYLWMNHKGVIWIIGLIIGGFMLAYLAYSGAVSQAINYGMYIRSTVDIYRLKLLQELHFTLPPTPLDEKKFWRKLEEWLYNRDDGVLPEIVYEHDQQKNNQGIKQEKSFLSIFRSHHKK